MTVTVADLKGGKLVGLKRVKKPKSSDVVVPDEIDLPLDGSYKLDLDGKSFMPVGHGFPKPKPQKIPTELAIYRLMAGTKNPHQDVKDWMKEYEENFLERHTELALIASDRK